MFAFASAVSTNATTGCASGGSKYVASSTGARSVPQLAQIALAGLEQHVARRADHAERGRLIGEPATNWWRSAPGCRTDHVGRRQLARRHGDDALVRVEDRATGVARVDRRVGLQEVLAVEQLIRMRDHASVTDSGRPTGYPMMWTPVAARAPRDRGAGRFETIRSVSGVASSTIARSRLDGCAARCRRSGACRATRPRRYGTARRRGSSSRGC